MKKYVANICPATDIMTMITNAGTKTLDREGDVPGFMKAYQNDDNMTNVFSLAKCTDAFTVTLDSRVDNAFHLHTPAGIVRVPRTEKDIYAFTPGSSIKRAVAELNQRRSVPVSNAAYIATVEENAKKYTARERARAKEARALQHALCLPTEAGLKSILRTNFINNCPLTTKDFNIAEDIYSTDIPHIKGKWTRRKPEPTKIDIIEIPKEIQMKCHNLELYFDVMFICKVAFFTSIDGKIMFRSCVPIDNRKEDEFYRALDVVLRHYNGAGYRITDGHCDREFTSLMDRVKDDLNIRLHYTGADDHVPAAERNNRTIQERFRSMFHLLPYKSIPRVMIEGLAMDCTNKLNLFPVKGGISPYFSPHTLMGGPRLDYNKHLKVAFGTYVMASNEPWPSNTPEARAIDAIFLAPPNARENAYAVMNLHSGRRVSRRHVHPLPLTESAKQAVEKLAEMGGFKSLKFRNRHGVTLHPADWIAGVDYDTETDIDLDDDEQDDDYNPHQIDEVEMPDEYIEDAEEFEQVDQAELEGLATDLESNPTVVQDTNENDDDQEPDVVEEPETTATDVVNTSTRRSTRAVREPARLQMSHGGKSYVDSHVTFQFDKIEYCHNLITQVPPNPKLDFEYTLADAMLVAKVMNELHAKINIKGPAFVFAEQYMLHKGIKKFGAEGYAAVLKEIDQIDKRECFKPISIKEMTPSERMKCMQSITLLTEKRDGTIKARTVADGRLQRPWTTREESASPTAALESIFILAVIDAKEGRDVMTTDVPNAFLHSVMPEVEPGEDRVIMKITGVLVDMLVELNPDLYESYVVWEKGKKVLYVQIMKALYGMLQASLLWYKTFRSDLEGYGFVFNPYDPCVANMMTEGKQHTIRFHVDDLKSSHLNPKVNDRFKLWLNDKYGGYGKVKVVRGKIHEFLGMIFDYETPGEVKVDMRHYVNDMIDSLSVKIEGIEKTPAADDLLSNVTGSKLPKDRAEEFHTTVAKGLFVCKRARPDIQPTVAILCTRVKEPTIVRLGQDDTYVKIS